MSVTAVRYALRNDRLFCISFARRAAVADSCCDEDCRTLTPADDADVSDAALAVDDDEDDCDCGC